MFCCFNWLVRKDFCFLFQLGLTLNCFFWRKKNPFECMNSRSILAIKLFPSLSLVLCYKEISKYDFCFVYLKRIVIHNVQIYLSCISTIVKLLHNCHHLPFSSIFFSIFIYERWSWQLTGEWHRVNKWMVLIKYLPSNPIESTKWKYRSPNNKSRHSKKGGKKRKHSMRWA